MVDAILSGGENRVSNFDSMEIDDILAALREFREMGIVFDDETVTHFLRHRAWTDDPCNYEMDRVDEARI